MYRKFYKEPCVSTKKTSRSSQNAKTFLGNDCEVFMEIYIWFDIAPFTYKFITFVTLPKQCPNGTK